MKKRFLVLFIFIFLLVCGCQEPQEKVTCELDTSAISESVNLSEFDLSQLKIVLTIGENQRIINVDDSMISEADAASLKFAGEHTIHIIYKSYQFEVTINLIDDHKTQITYDIDTTLLPTINTVDSFEISEIRIRINTDGVITYVNVNEGMISKVDLDKLSSAGTHTITIKYGDFTGTVTVTLVDNSTVNPTGTFSSNMAYYSSANGKAGNELKLALRTIISQVTHRETYDDLKSDTILTDTDPNNSKNIILFYSQKSVKGTWDSAKTWNREHVWAQSLGWFKTSGAGSDIHHLRPEDPSLNSTRGNKKFGEIRNNSTAKEIRLSAANGGGLSGCYYSGDYFEPQDCVKGDVARIIFYLLVRYSEADSYSFTRIAQSKEMLLKWNAQDPVDELEIHRNEAAYKIQGNRNPFIDHPEAASLIWGSYKVSYEENQSTIEIVWYIDKKHSYAYL